MADTKDNKDARIYLRIKKSLKCELKEALEYNGDDMSGFLTRAIKQYVNKYKEQKGDE